MAGMIGYNPSASTWSAPSATQAAVPVPPTPPAWLTPSTSTTTYGNTASGTAGNIPPPMIPPFPGGSSTYINPADALRQIQQLMPAPPPIVAPQVQAAQIQVPGGSYDAYREALYESQFAPVQRELSRQAGIADENAAGMLAQAGLADSGTGVGQRMDVAREYDQRIGDASQDISAAATASTEQARFNILSANAQLQQQANLANQGFDYNAQVANAQNLLNNNGALAQGYLNALGVSAQQASNWTSAYLNYFSEAERNKILKDQALQQFHGEWLNYLIQKEKVAADVDIQNRQLSLQQRELQQQEDLERMRLAQQNQQFNQEYQLGQRGLDLQALELQNQQNQPDRRLMYDNAGVSPYTQSNAYGASTGYSSPLGF